jgi:hypothetical protein
MTDREHTYLFFTCELQNAKREFGTTGWEFNGRGAPTKVHGLTWEAIHHV